MKEKCKFRCKTIQGYLETRHEKREKEGIRSLKVGTD